MAWPKVRLEEVLTHRKEFVTIDDLQAYKRPRVQLHAQGIVLRNEVPGALIKTKKQQVCRAGEFLVAEIDAKVGGFGIVPSSLDGSIVSSHYFLFVIDESKLNRSFLDFFIRTPAFREQVAAQGSTNYAAIRPAHVLGYEITLPPLTEQRRIVARIETLAAKIAEARRLRQSIEEDEQLMLQAEFHRIAAMAPLRPMSEVAPLFRRPVNIVYDEEYPQISVRSFGRGVFHNPPLRGAEVTWQKPYLVKTGDILISNIKAWEGAVAVVTETDDERVGSHRYLTCVPIPGVATARFVCFYLLTEKGLHFLGESSPGSADRNRTLSTKGLMNIPVPVPPYEAQKRFDALYGKVDALKRTQTEAAAELDAMLPAILHRAFKGEL